ncbi:MAG: LamG-like jellyroll fold domain-containing protein [bacterium]
MKKREEGFTLIELMVVISIIGFLASIILANLNIAREKGRIAAGEEMEANINHTTEQLALQLNFDGNLTDSSGLNATVYQGAVSYESGVNGQAVRLTKTGLAIANNPAFNSSSFTLSFWVKPYSNNGGFGCCYGGSNGLASMEDYLADGFRFGFGSDGKLEFWTGESGGTIYIESKKTIQIGKFNQVVLTYGNGSGTLYLDGQNAGSSKGNYIAPQGQALFINEGAPNNYYNGDMAYDDFRFYGQALTAEEIKHNYLAQAQKELARN